MDDTESTMVLTICWRPLVKRSSRKARMTHTACSTYIGLHIYIHLFIFYLNFVFSFNRRDDSETGNTLVFQYGTALTGWTDATVGSTGGTVGSATIAITENSTSPDAITVTVPKSVAPGGQLFGRLKVTNP
jgi:hypothetical protein